MGYLFRAFLILGVPQGRPCAVSGYAHWSRQSAWAKVNMLKFLEGSEAHGT